MTISGDLLIGGSKRRGSNGAFQALDAATGQVLEGSFGGASLDDLEEAARLASQALIPYRDRPLKERSSLLSAIADEIAGLDDELVLRCMAETGLARTRILVEKARTVGQLRFFASVVLDGRFLDVRIDPALPERVPLPRPDIRAMKIPLGPVAVFGASNFPLAFSVAGGDTASALAAGCPVVVKAHSAHPGTSELVGLAVQRAVRTCGFPDGVFSLIYDSGNLISQALVADPRIKAVGFTGSRRGGTTFMRIAAAREQPIPVYAEMSSINPVILFPGALATRGAEIADGFIQALTLGAGQFCTNPGLVLAIEGTELDAFEKAAAAALCRAPAATMLTEGILGNYHAGVARFEGSSDVQLVAQGQRGGEREAPAAIFATSAEVFLANAALRDEVFGAASLVVRCSDQNELLRVLDRLEGQLTVALHLEPEDYASAQRLLPTIMALAGRVLVNGFGTGVEVTHAMVHGGPYPSTSDGRSSSVGSFAIERFLRPVCFQDVPAALLPLALGDERES